MNNAIKTTLYIGSGKSGAAVVKEIDAELAKKRPDVEGVSALMMYAFNLLKDLDPKIESAASAMGLTPADLINQAVEAYLKTRKKAA